MKLPKLFPLRVYTANDYLCSSNQKKPLTFPIFLLLVSSLITCVYVSSCGGGGGSNGTSIKFNIDDDDDITITGKVVETVKIESGVLDLLQTDTSSASRVASVGDTEGMTVSLTGCSSTTTTESDGSFTLTIPSSCSGDNLILTASSSDETEITRKVISVSTLENSYTEEMRENDTIEALSVEFSAYQLAIMYSEYSSVKDALQTINTQSMTSLLGYFDRDENGTVSIIDFDVDSDEILSFNEIEAVSRNAILFSLGQKDLPDIVVEYDKGIIEGNGIAYGTYADGYTCKIDMGTPEDTNDDKSCFYGGDYDIFSHMDWSYYIDKGAILIRDIVIDQINDDETTWSQKLFLSGLRKDYSDEEKDVFYETQFRYTIKRVDGEWKIASELRKSGTLEIEVKTDKDTYQSDEDIELSILLTNTGPGHCTMVEPLDSGNWTVVRPDGKHLFPYYEDILLKAIIPVGISNGETYSQSDSIHQNCISGCKKWGEVGVFDYNNPVNYDMDIPGEYKIRFYYALDTLDSNCYEAEEEYSDSCLNSATASFTIDSGG